MQPHGVPFTGAIGSDGLLSWGVDVAAIQDAALGNLAAWSATAAWTADAVSANETASVSTTTASGH